LKEPLSKIIKEGEIECSAPIRPEGEKKRGRLKWSKARNLLERQKNFEKDTLRFMDNELVPFTNNALTLLFLGKDPDFMTADVNSSANQ